MAGSLHGFNLE